MFAKQARANGQGDDSIVKYLSEASGSATDPEVQAVIKKAKEKGIPSSQILDHLSQIPVTTVNKDDFKQGGILGGINSFIGSEKLTRRLGGAIRGLFTNESEESKKLVESGALTADEAKTISQRGVNNRELVGSILQTGLSLGSLGAGKALSAGGLLAKTAKAASLGGAFGASGALADDQDSGGIIQGAIFGGILGGAIPLAGAGLKSLTRGIRGLPEKAYTTVFKNAEDDLIKNFRSEKLVEMQAQNPAQFKQLVEKGIVHVGEGGIPKVNPTLAREAMEKGLKGSAENMFKYSYGKTVEIENEVVNAARASKKPISLGSKKDYTKLLQQIKQQYGDSQFSQTSQKADEILQLMKKVKGDNVDVETGLKLRRFLDNARKASSFKMNPALSPKEELFKGAADKLRANLNKVPGIGERMNDYRQFIEFQDALIDHARKTNNAPLLSAFDTMLGTGGLLLGSPAAGVAAATARRTLLNPAVLTNMGSAVEATMRAGSKLVPPASVGTAARTLGRTAANEGIANLPRMLR